ncbi:hypothetical protein ACWEH1_16525 [Micromonospora chersina]
MSLSDRRAYTPRHAAPEAAPAAAVERPAAPAPSHLAKLAAAVVLVALSGYVMTADRAGPGGPEGSFGGGEWAAPDPLPSATGPTAAPSTPGTTPSRPADPGVPGEASPTPGTTASRTSTPEAAREPSVSPAPRTTAPRRAAPAAVSGGTARGPVGSGSPRPAPTPGPADPTPGPSDSPNVPPPTGAERCGAPENPYGYTYCSGALVHEPAPDVCRWFVCVPGFWAGRGYLTVCADGRIGMVGGPTGRCPERAGRKDPVYANQPAG